MVSGATAVGRHRTSRSGNRRRIVGASTALVLSAGLLTACGQSSGPPVLNWYINPDNGGQARLAASCVKQSHGAYQVTIQTLPTDASSQREQLIRRLAAKDSSIDVMSLDPPFVPEAAQAGFLRPFSSSDAKTLTQGVLPAPLKTAYWGGKLVAAPFWANTQLLWYRKSVAKAAGVNPASPNFTWSDMMKAAEKEHKIIGVQASLYEGYMVWINALVASAGGQIISDPSAGQNAKPTINSPAGDKAATIIGDLARSSAAPPAMSTMTEEQSRAAFQGSNGGFMVNWPYVYAAAKGDVASGALSKSAFNDIAWARYPAVKAGEASKPPLGGINLAIGAYTAHPQQAVQLVKCVTSLQNNVKYMLDSGNPAAKGAAYDNAQVKKAFPMAALIRSSIATAGPRPITPFYNDVSTSIQKTWHPATSVTAPATPNASATYMHDVLQGTRLL